jgi:uncharacterized protein (UPF0335 family)
MANRKKSIVNKKYKLISGSQWPVYILISIFFFVTGAGLSYHLLNAGRLTEFILRIAELEKELSGLEQEYAEINAELEISNLAKDKLLQDLTAAKEENNILQEDVLFYEKIVGKRKK